MGRIRVSGIVRLLRLLLLLPLSLPAEGQTPSYFLYPQNLTVETGKSVSLQCGVNGLGSKTFQFFIMGSKINASVTCPGTQTTYYPAQAMTSQCSSGSSGTVASWNIGSTSENDNSTVFLCRCSGLSDVYGHLNVYENSGYYAKIIAIGIAGFLGCLIFLIVSYILLKRSEKAQRCFRSVGGLSDDER